MSNHKKMFLPILLLILAVGIEIVGIILCGKMLPDYKNEVFSDEKNNITSLIFIGDEDNSRFYPWLSYHEDEMIPVRTYIENHLYDRSVEIFTYTDNDSDNKSDAALKETVIYNLNQMIFCAIENLDSENYPKEDIDFSKYAEFDNNASILRIKNLEYKNRDNKTKLLDLVMLYSNDILYFRIRDKNPPKPTSQEINAKSKKLSENVIETFDLLTTLVPELPKNSEKEISREQSVQNADNYSKSYSENILINYITNIKTADFYIDDGRYIFSSATDDKFNIPVRITVPSIITSSQYTVFSNNDELMIVFSGADNRSKYSNTILYYSISENRITGFSMRTIF